MLANMSIEPIITVYVAQLVSDVSKVTIVSGIVMSAAALGSILSASRLGKLADRIGHWNVIIGALAISALLLIPQAFVTQGWQLILLRFLMGLALGGLLPCITSVIRHNVPDRVAGYPRLRHLVAICGTGRRAAGGRVYRRTFWHARCVSRDVRAHGFGRNLHMAGAAEKRIDQAFSRPSPAAVAASASPSSR